MWALLILGPCEINFSISISPTSQTQPNVAIINDPVLYKLNLKPEFKSTDISSSTYCQIIKPLAAARQYMEQPVHCSSVVLLGTNDKQDTYICQYIVSFDR